jgi:hypothetical protein
LHHLFVGIGATPSDRTMLAAAIVVGNLVSRDTGQPCAETVRWGIAAKRIHGDGHSPKDLLDQVCSFFSLHTRLATPSVNHWPIEIGQTLPGFRPMRSDTLKKRG